MADFTDAVRACVGRAGREQQFHMVDQFVGQVQTNRFVRRFSYVKE
jgi:hypothetical protein